ncbi:MAG: HD domain-containing protein [Bacteroidales bacterium]|mgnify:FL=1|jgi:putative nucleotidyltransferase with HDIG domain|nr:HD domain-containing protein [Bacteroidales bacterium]HPB01312.1 HD domain-containing protein [Bacteroidales bacterium]HPE99554.1 HD domain-containing protein [Bacteroidales bacterium]
MDFERVKDYMMQRLSRGLAPNLYYHGIHHTVDVMRAAEEIAAAERVVGMDKTILMTAALFHDVGFLIRYKENEDISAGMCWNILPRFNYTQSEIMMIAHIIMSTSIPQKPVDKLDSIMCDADLDYLGRDDFFIIGCNLRREWKEYGRELTVKEWYFQQIDFLSAHHYFTKTATLLREEKKLRHLDYLIRLVNKK